MLRAMSRICSMEMFPSLYSDLDVLDRPENLESVMKIFMIQLFSKAISLIIFNTYFRLGGN